MYSRLITVVLFFLTFGLFSSASPTTEIEARAVEKRAVVLDVVADVSVKVDAIIDAFVAVDAVANIEAIIDVFASASTSLKTLGPVSLSSADKNTVAKNVANAINSAAAQLGKTTQSSEVIAASVKLDAQIKIFLDLLGIVVIGIVGIVAKLIIDVHLLVIVHLKVVASVFIDLLGIVIIL